MGGVRARAKPYFGVAASTNDPTAPTIRRRSTDARPDVPSGVTRTWPTARRPPARGHAMPHRRSRGRGRSLVATARRRGPRADDRRLPDASAVYLVAVVVVGSRRRDGAGGRHGGRRLPRLRPPVHRARGSRSSSPTRTSCSTCPGPVRRARRRAPGAVEHARAAEADRGRPRRRACSRSAARSRRPTSDRGRRRRDRRAAGARRRPRPRLDRLDARRASAGPRRHRRRPTARRRPSIARPSSGRPGDEPARWVRAHGLDAARHARRPPADRRRSSGSGSRPMARSSARSWAIRERDAGRSRSRRRPGSSPWPPTRSPSALRRDRLRQDATDAEVARRSDALKSALLDSVSHDLRTPLASIRATAGNLADPGGHVDRRRRRAAAASHRRRGPAPRSVRARSSWT